MPKFDYSKVRGKIAEKGLTREEVADFVGITSTTLTSRMHNKSPWRQNEICRMAELLGITGRVDEYFFTPAT